MPGVLVECRQICAVKTIDYQELLKVRIAKFIGELAVMAVQVEDLKYWGDLAQLHKYVFRSSALSDKCFSFLIISKIVFICNTK